MRTKIFISLVLVVMFSVCVVSAQKKSKPSENKTTSATQYPEKKVFLDINGVEISPEEFREKLLLGEFGLKISLIANVENRQLVPLDEIVLKDENDKILSVYEYRTKLISNKFELIPIFENNKITGLKLKPYVLMDQTAPEYSAVTLNGKTVTSKSQQGKLTVMNFWYIGCIPCMEEIPELNKVAEKYKNNPDITFLAVSIDSVERLKEFLSKNRFDFQIVFDRSSMTKDFQANINGFPTTVIINRNGKITFYRSYLGRNAKFLDIAISKELNENQD